MVAISMMSAKMAALVLLKIEVFWNEDYDAIIYVTDVINQILLRDSNYDLDVVMWPKFGNSSIYMIKVIIKRIWSEKPLFLRGGLSWRSIAGGWHLVCPWNFTPL